MKEITVAAKTENWDEVLAFFENWLDETDASMKTRMQLSIALEEMFVNVAHYAYQDTALPEEARTATIALAVEDGADGEGKKICVTLTDNGIYYDPLAKADPDTTLSADKRQIGGLGIFMVKKSMDHVAYERRDNKNIFRMEKGI